mgnify:CR=1 FL=1
MDRFIDDLARITATSPSRRQAFRLIAGLFGAVLVALVSGETVQAACPTGTTTCFSNKRTNICCAPNQCCAGKGPNAQCCSKGSCACPNGSCSPSFGGSCPNGCSYC